MFSLVIPTFNEGPNIGPLIGRIEAVLNQELIDFEIILVDDNSPDETWKLAQEIANEDFHLWVIRREGARGCRRVASGKGGDFGGNGCGSAASARNPLPSARVHFKGTRRNLGRKPTRFRRRDRGMEFNEKVRFSGSGGNRFLACASNPPAHPGPHVGLFLIKRSEIDSARLMPKEYKIFLEILAKGNYRRIVEGPYVFEERKNGKSKLGPKQYLEFLIHVGMLAARSRVHSYS
jgi:dolichol-phosphate mannosyltransferase